MIISNHKRKLVLMIWHTGLNGSSAIESAVKCHVTDCVTWVTKLDYLILLHAAWGNQGQIVETRPFIRNKQIVNRLTIDLICEA